MQPETRARYREILSQLPAYTGESLAGYRQQVNAWCRQLADLGLARLGLPVEDGGNPEELLALARCLLHFDMSLFVKFGIHVGLVQGCLARLGTERHRHWLGPTSTLEQLGCFAMTETDHGSNVRGLETRADYLPESQEFRITTPHRGAFKDYIGGALSARFAIVFSQFEEHGVHPFLVPLRDAEGRLLPGIEAEDCGPKMGLNGIDNGRLAFHGVTIPRENLLDRHAQVAADGTYSSPIVNPTKRFFTMVSNLVDGRLSLAAASYEVSAAGLSIALRYADRRRQFGPPGQPETRLLDYQMHQLRLLPRVALTIALERGVQLFVQLYRQQDPDLETFAAGLKAYATWSVAETLRQCRDCCGGWGYLAVNRFATLKADSDIFTTFEGDNTVLSFLVARNLLKQLRGCRGLLQLIPWPRRAGRDLLARPVQVAALMFREQRLLAGLGRRLRHRLRQGIDPITALGSCQQHALSLAQAHIERRLVEQFSPEDQWGTLYAIGCLVADRAWFLEHGYLSARQSKRLRALQSELCQNLRGHSLDEPLIHSVNA